jgi:hypothetical protein
MIQEKGRREGGHFIRGHAAYRSGEKIHMRALCRGRSPADIALSQSGTIAEIGDLDRMTDEKAPRRLGPLPRALTQWLDLSGTVPAEHTQLLSQLDQTTGEISGYKFKIGQAVQFSPQCARIARGLYVVTGLLPERDGEFEYCIYNEAEPYQRVAKESELR